jgi:PAS domain S-box-containing protein
VIDLSQDVFWETDASHRFTKISVSPRRGVALSLDSELGKTRWEVPYVEPDEAAWVRHRAQLDAHEVFHEFELARPTVNGEVRYAEVSGAPVFDAEGAFVGYSGVSKDITARKKAEGALLKLNADLEHRVTERTAALEVAYRELESFSYAVSHDLRAPLRSISGFATLLREDEGDKLSAEGLRFLKVMDESAQHMGRLTDALLDLARTSRRALHREPVDMHRLAQQSVSELAVDYPNARITVAALAPAVGDATLLHQVWSNLVSNALKYSSRAAAPSVELGALGPTGETAYFVRDNGAGFEMQYVNKLFHPFGRLHAEKDFPGTGVGLVVAKMIVERHGGRIWAESKPGEGAVFYFTLAPHVLTPNVPGLASGR